jgi:hypothetical protein
MGKECKMPYCITLRSRTDALITGWYDGSDSRWSTDRYRQKVFDNKRDARPVCDELRGLCRGAPPGHCITGHAEPARHAVPAAACDCASATSIVRPPSPTPRSPSARRREAVSVESQVRTRLFPGGSRIRTRGPRSRSVDSFGEVGTVTEVTDRRFNSRPQL